MNESNENPMLIFERSLRSLEAIVEKLRQEQLGLEEMISLYEEGIVHLESCQKYLELAEVNPGPLPPPQGRISQEHPQSFALQRVRGRQAPAAISDHVRLPDL